MVKIATLEKPGEGKSSFEEGMRKLADKHKQQQLQGQSVAVLRSTDDKNREQQQIQQQP